MTTTTINLPLLRVLKSLNVSDTEAEAAAEATPPNLSQLATKDDLKVLATKDDLKLYATRDDLKSYATKDDLKVFATKDELRAEIAGVRAEIAGVKAEIARATQRQTVWVATIVLAATGAIIAAGRLAPPVPPTDAGRTTVEQAPRGQQVQPGAAQQPRVTPQP